MNLTLVFGRKYRWPEHYFSVWCLGSSQNLLTTNQFLVSTILFTIVNISFFNLRFDFFSIIAQKSTGRCNAFQHIFGNRSCTAHISRLCCVMWLWFNKPTYSWINSRKYEIATKEFFRWKLTTLHTYSKNFQKLLLMTDIELYFMKKYFITLLYFRVILRFKVIGKLNYHYLLSAYCMTFDIL